jgi:hypothetical protein
MGCGIISRLEARGMRPEAYGEKSGKGGKSEKGLKLNSVVPFLARPVYCLPRHKSKPGEWGGGSICG